MIRRRLGALAAVLCLASLPVHAAVTPSLNPHASAARAKARIAPPGTGVLSSSNVQLLATIPDTGATGGRFIDGGHYFVTTVSAPFPAAPGPNSAVRIYDTSMPELPVLIGTLPLPHYENEDVDVSESRRLILVSQDVDVLGATGGALYVVDFSIANAPILKGFLRYPVSVKTSDGRNAGGPGHIANCIADCARYAYVTGARNGSVFVVDLADPAHPVIATTISQLNNPAGEGNAVFKTGIVHDVYFEPGTSNAWFTGSGGTTMMDVSDPLNPVLKYRVSSADNATWDQFIHHNSIRLDAQTMLVTEEDWDGPCSGSGGREQGGFQTWHIPGTATGTLTHLDQWITEAGSYDSGTAPLDVYCSSHWFTHNGTNIVAVGWYNQGLRLLDVSDPSNIRQVGYFIGPGAMASAGLFHPRGDIVYVPDYQRGLDVVRIDHGGAQAPTVVAPLRAEWFTQTLDSLGVRPDPAFGYACLRRVSYAAS